MPLFPGSPALCLLALVAPPPQEGAGHAREADDFRIRWYAGDTHEHFQPCIDPPETIDDLLARLEAEKLSVSSVLVWDPGPHLAFTDFACLVTGQVDSHSSPHRLLQFGAETSGLDCGKWGHLSGLGIGPTQALFPAASQALGDCYDGPGLVPACGGDRTGFLAAPVARLFYQTPGAVCGYAHSIWSLDDYAPNGFAWFSELVASGFTTDARCIDPAQLLAVPNLVRLLAQQQPVFRAFFPLFGAADAVLGEVQFVETITLGPAFPLTFNPAAHWQGLTYRFASLGLRIALAAGSDEDCSIIPASQLPRTYVWLDEPLTYAAWTRALAAGRSTVGIPGLRIDLRANRRRLGQDLYLEGQTGIEVLVEVESEGALNEQVELLVDGEVYASQPVSIGAGESRHVFPDVVLPESTWLAARLSSQRAHTGPLYVYVDGRPISDCVAAEYWMLWCDIVTKTDIQIPQFNLFGCQRSEALAQLRRARRAFKAHRDIEGFETAFQAERYGRSTPGCRGPISIGTTQRARSHQPLLLTCVNAPPLAEGVLHLSRTQDLAGTCTDGVRTLVGTGPDAHIGSYPVVSTRSGYADALVPEVPHGEGQLYAQIVWTNPDDCPGQGCADAEEPPALSASDALALVVEVPPLGTLSVTPGETTLPRGRSQALAARGTFADGYMLDLTSGVTWSSSDEGVVQVSNLPGSAGVATGLALGTAEITATDVASGISGTALVSVVPPVLESITVAPAQAALALGFDQAFVATGTYSDATTQDLTDTVSWSSSDAGVASLSPDLAGLAETLATGSATIVATDPGQDLQGTAELVVTPAVLTAIEVFPASADIPLGTSQVFHATGRLSDDTLVDLSDSVEWSSSDPLVAVVTDAPEGVNAKSLSLGSSEIRATEPLTQLSSAGLLTVAPPALVALELAPVEPVIGLGTGASFTATGHFTDGTSADVTAAVLWSSSAPAVATVENAPGSAGLATSLSVGTTTITAATPGGALGAATTLTVRAVLETITVLPTNPSVLVGSPRAFTALGDFNDGTTLDLTSVVVWSSARPLVATISNLPGREGRAHGQAPGLATITALDPDTGVAGSTVLRVIAAP